MMQKQPAAPTMLPTLPELQLNLAQFDEEDDAEEEKNMMNILLKLKNAQNSMNESRKRKRSKQLGEEALQKYSSDCKELVAKHNRRWSAKFNTLTQKGKKLKQNGENLLEKIDTIKRICTTALDKHQKAVGSVLDSLTSLEKECSNAQFDNKENFDNDVSRIRTQVKDRLREMKEVLIRTHSQSTKDDRFTKIIKSFLVNF